MVKAFTDDPITPEHLSSRLFVIEQTGRVIVVHLNIGVKY